MNSFRRYFIYIIHVVVSVPVRSISSGHLYGIPLWPAEKIVVFFPTQKVTCITYNVKRNHVSVVELSTPMCIVILRTKDINMHTIMYCYTVGNCYSAAYHQVLKINYKVLQDRMNTISTTEDKHVSNIIT